MVYCTTFGARPDRMNPFREREREECVSVFLCSHHQLVTDVAIIFIVLRFQGLSKMNKQNNSFLERIRQHINFGSLLNRRQD